jgi:hypothetical protein
MRFVRRWTRCGTRLAGLVAISTKRTGNIAPAIAGLADRGELPRGSPVRYYESTEKIADMTLCALQRQNQQVWVATDSRLTWRGRSVPADVGVKLMPLVLRVYGAVEAGSNAPPTLLHTRVLGLATVGSLVTTFVAKQLLEAVLSSLQAAGHLADLSMRTIAEVCAKVLESVSRDVCNAIFEDGTGQLVLVGKCLETHHPRVFVLRVPEAGGGKVVEIEEVLQENGVLYLGSGREAAEAINPTGWLFDTVQKVADDPEVPSVGGNVQFGVLSEDDFRIMGVRAVKVNHDLKEFYIGYFVAGLEILGGDAFLADRGLILRGSFLNPIDPQVRELLMFGYMPVRSMEHWEPSGEPAD